MRVVLVFALLAGVSHAFKKKSIGGALALAVNDNGRSVGRVDDDDNQTSDASQNSSTAVQTSKQQKNESGHGSPLLPYKKEYCAHAHIRRSQCTDDIILAEEEHCAEVAKKFKHEAQRREDRRCNEFKHFKNKIIDSQASRQQTTRIREAGRLCSDEVLQVCIGSSCPAYCAAKGMSCNCEDICTHSTEDMLDTGSLNCGEDDREKDKSFEDCFKDFQQALADQGRHPELEALLRELIYKCVCVSWHEPHARDVCYEGSQGIPRGQRWCDYDGTPSWQKMISKAGVQMPHANCTEFLLD